MSAIPLPDQILLEIVSNLENYKKDLDSRIPGFVVSDKMVQGQPDRGRVHAIGSDIKESELVVGDLVIFKKEDTFLGFEIDGLKLINVKPGEICGKMVG